jgi:hypothetical protein
VAPVSAKSGGSVAPGAALLHRHRKAFLAGAAALLLLIVYPFAVGGLAARLFAARLGGKLGRPVAVGQGRGGLGRIVLRRMTVGGAPGSAGTVPIVTAEEISLPWSVAWGGSTPITIIGLRVNIVRGGDNDNVTDIIEHLRGARAAAHGAGADGKASTSSSSSSSSLPGVRVESGAVSLHDLESGLAVKIGGVVGMLLPGRQASVRLRDVSGLLALGGGDKGPRFGAAELDLRAALSPPSASSSSSGLRPQGYPIVRVQDGFATPLPSLSLTGISGTVGPPPTGPGATSDPAASPGVVIDLHGSYGGARESLWTAKGTVQPTTHEGRLSLRAAQFSLDKIADVLPRSVLSPAHTSIDAAFDLTWLGEAVRFGGDLAVTGLSLQNDALSAAPIEGLSLGLVLRGSAYPARRRVELEVLEGRLRNLVGRVTGSVELPRGKYTFSDGSHLGMVPKIDLALNVPRLPCAKLLASVPAALTPKLQGFVLQGFFDALVGTKIDFADLESLDLRGRVGLNGCKVVKAPDAVAALREAESIVQTIEVPKPPGAAPGETEEMQFIVGPDNPDFTPYPEISPYFVSSILTTEDNGFFKHHGWVTSQFRGALKRNLERGGFRIGASSITMQMVKNVLLSQEKTLSRKLQELFLVWYLEQVLPKERILELYFNAIEFGPRIYGIGAAARHYFGKKPSELTPLEGAFFSSILPNPKRRYIQFCHGSLYPPWDKYVHRILARVHERGHITDEEYVEAASQSLVFDRHEATFTEKQCLDWVKKMTTRPEPEAPPELDAGEGDLASADGPTHAVAKRHRRRRGAARAAVVNAEDPNVSARPPRAPARR